MSFSLERLYSSRISPGHPPLSRKKNHEFSEQSALKKSRVQAASGDLANPLSSPFRLNTPGTFSVGVNTLSSNSKKSRPDRLVPSRFSMQQFQSKDQFGFVFQQPSTKKNQTSPVPFPMKSFDSQGKFVVTSGNPEWERIVKGALFKAPTSSLLFPSQTNEMLPIYVADRAKVIANIFKRAYHVADAPGISNDFYVRPISWNRKEIIAVVLKNLGYNTSFSDNPNASTLYFYSVSKLAMVSSNNLGTNKIVSVDWNPKDPTKILIAQDKKLFFQDVNSTTIHSVVSANAHLLQDRTIESSTWKNEYEVTFSTRGQNGISHVTSDIYEYDSRSRVVKKICSINADAIALKWSNSSNRLAIGLDENRVQVWDPYNEKFIFSLEHKAAVKALCWRPDSNSHQLFTGGGENGPDIFLSDTTTQTNLLWQKTHAQICDIAALTSTDILTAHGCEESPEKGLLLWHFNQNQMTLTPSSFLITANMKGRVLNLAVSPNLPIACSATSNERLLFHDPFGVLNKPIKDKREEKEASFASFTAKGTR